MRLEISGRHMEVTEALRSHVEGRLQKVRAHFDRVMDANVVLSVEKLRHIAEMTLHANGISIHGKEASPDMYMSIDAVVDKLEKQAVKYKSRTSRQIGRRTREQFETREMLGAAAESGEEPVVDSGPVATREIKRERLVMKPMSVEEASEQLELAGTTFLVFSNEETQKVNVIYADDDGDHVLIEPQF